MERQESSVKDTPNNLWHLCSFYFGNDPNQVPLKEINTLSKGLSENVRTGVDVDEDI